MNPFALTIREVIHRWKSSLLVVLIVAAITGTLSYFSVHNAGFQKEMTRNARDIGSNVVILPAELDQQKYHSDGGYSDLLMSADLVDQLIEYKASLNHLIPMLERKADCSFNDKTVNARIVGISASIPMPGRPKSPMQRSIESGTVQLGSTLANRLGIEQDATPEIMIAGSTFSVGRVNRANGTWQDAAVLMDLAEAQKLFDTAGRISRIEAIECTSEQCEQTGLKSEVVLANELGRITDQATILRRQQMADARSTIRIFSRESLRYLQNMLWVLLAISIVALARLNSYQRISEVGVLQALGYGQIGIVSMFVARSALLTLLGAIVGIVVSSFVALSQSQALFVQTGKKLAIDWQSAFVVGLVALILSALASSVPALLAASRHPADLIGKEN